MTEYTPDFVDYTPIDYLNGVVVFVVFVVVAGFMVRDFRRYGFPWDR